VARLDWSVDQARLYQLWAVGLEGTSYAAGGEGAARCFRDLGSVQLDPLPVLGRNHDLVLQARVPGTHPGDLLDLVHGKRLGFEYWDKMLCAIAIEAYPLSRGLMARAGDSWIERRGAQLETQSPGTLASVETAIREHGPLSSRELHTLDVAQAEHRGWKSTRAANVALETLWNRGLLAVSHRRNFRRYFDLAERVIPATVRAIPTPSPKEFERRALLRRVRSVGLLPSRGSADAWGMLPGVRRHKIPAQLVEEGALCELHVDGVRQPYYAAADAAERLATAERSEVPGRVRFLAPLDPLLWARESLRALWDFDYVWEVYKPAEQRRYGYYVLPVLAGTRFVARFDGRFDRRAGTLHVLSYHEEAQGMPLSHPAMHAAFQRFLVYLGGELIALPDGGCWQREDADEKSTSGD